MAKKPWTDKEFQQAKKLIDSGLGWSQIAAKLGRSISSVRGKLFGVEGHNNKAATSSGPVDRRIEKLTDSLARARGRDRVKFSAGTSKLKGDLCRIVIPDVHGSFLDKAAVNACLADIKQLNPQEVVLLGDVIDCGGFLAQQHVWGYVAEAEYHFEDDVGHANDFLSALQEAAPNAEFHFLEGNHERRIETWCLTQTLRSGPDAEYMLKMFAVEKLLHLKERGFKWYKQGRFYDGCGKPNTIRLGKCFFTHGEKSGKDAAKNMLREFGFNVCFGHTHTSAEAAERTVQHGVIKAWSPGSLCRLQPLWCHGRVTAWNHGYGVQFVSKKTGRFQHINVAIHEGRSLLGPLLSRMGCV